jgi:hypothetical protein
VGGQHRLLQDIVGILGAAGAAGRQQGQLSVVAVEEFCERTGIARDVRGDQLVVRALTWLSCRDGGHGRHSMDGPALRHFTAAADCAQVRMLRAP